MGRESRLTMGNKRPVLALEVSSLGERHFTGIANVTRMLARELLDDASVEAKFMMGRSEVPIACIESLLTLSGGEILWWLSGRLNSSPSFGGDLDRPIIGIYPATKPHRRLFPFEVLIIHDLTTVVTPQYHSPESVAFWQRHLLPDMMSSELLVAVSKSTEADIRTYFPQVSNIPCCVVSEAACVGQLLDDDDHGDVEPFILVLGTLEPRKNISLVLQMLSSRPDLLGRNKFVFVGRWGWGPRTSDLLEQFGLTQAAEQGRIIFTGFVSNEARDQLLAAARAVIYPSLYEGFGLPIIEAMYHGTPVITTYSTSLPEVGGALALYFDPVSEESLATALHATLSQAEAPTNVDDRERRRNWAQGFTWSATYRSIRDGALALESQP